MQFPNRSDSAARTNTNRQDARGELHAKLLSCTTVSGRPRPEATAGPGHSHQNHRRRRCGERRQGQSKHTRTKPRSIGGRRGACGAWPDNESTRPATRQRHSAAGVKGAGGFGGPGRASRSTTPSRRLACGDLAGGRARRRPEHQRRNKQRRISGGPPPTGAQSRHTETLPPQQAAPTAATAQ